MLNKQRASAKDSQRINVERSHVQSKTIISPSLIFHSKRLHLASTRMAYWFSMSIARLQGIKLYYKDTNV